MSPFHKVRNDSRNHDADEDDDTPVERRGVHGRAVGPQRPEEGKDGVADPEDVHRHPPAAEAPACRGQELWLEKAAVEDTADRDGVGGHERGDLEGDDGVEGDRGADVDEREEAGEGAGKRDGVCGDVHGRVHLADPPGKGQTVVTGKGEGLAGGGGVEGDVRRNDQDQDHDG